MKYDSHSQSEFMLDLSEHQISAREFFGITLIDLLKKNFDITKVVILCFDTENNYLSCIDNKGIRLAKDDGPYSSFLARDVIGNKIYKDAVRDGLTYFNVEPRVYKATDIISDYEESFYLKFMEKHFGGHYTATFALGLNAYLRLVIFKTKEEGDFTDKEIANLKVVYTALAGAYKNFKKFEQAKIVSNIQNEIIRNGESAYLVTDDFNRIMSYNFKALEYLEDILGIELSEEEMSRYKASSFVPFLMDGTNDADDRNVIIKRIRGYTCKTYKYDQKYSHGMVDRYHWITISKETQSRKPEVKNVNTPFTKTEQVVAGMLKQGLTYQQIADKLVISYHTVKNHVRNIYSKCGVSTRVQLIHYLENN